jgi:hypothetical protein
MMAKYGENGRMQAEFDAEGKFACQSLDREDGATGKNFEQMSKLDVTGSERVREDLHPLTARSARQARCSISSICRRKICPSEPG